MRPEHCRSGDCSSPAWHVGAASAQHITRLHIRVADLQAGAACDAPRGGHTCASGRSPPAERGWGRSPAVQAHTGPACCGDLTCKQRGTSVAGPSHRTHLPCAPLAVPEPVEELCSKVPHFPREHKGDNPAGAEQAHPVSKALRHDGDGAMGVGPPRAASATAALAGGLHDEAGESREERRPHNILVPHGEPGNHTPTAVKCRWQQAQKPANSGGAVLEQLLRD
jgi:hypothetical protein